MPDTIRVFVNQRAMDLAPGTTVTDAVRAADSALARALADGIALVTDGRGLPLAPDQTLSSGAIVRVVISSRGEAGAPQADDALP